MFFQVMIDNVGDVFFTFLRINSYFAWSAFPCSAEANIGRSGKLNDCLMASCVRNIHTWNY